MTKLPAPRIPTRGEVRFAARTAGWNTFTGGVYRGDVVRILGGLALMYLSVTLRPRRRFILYRAPVEPGQRLTIAVTRNGHLLETTEVEV